MTAPNGGAGTRGRPSHVVLRLVEVGTLAFIEERASKVHECLLSTGELGIYVAVDGSLAGAIVATDPVRSNARATIDALRNLGVASVAILTGDAKSTADHVVGVVGTDTVRIALQSIWLGIGLSLGLMIVAAFGSADFEFEPHPSRPSVGPSEV